ncbi:cupredoxin domain-containing protein [Craterilacuibacter sp.]|uniref:cupredoxin domain-containing protein n=1 Tax=Craterilacuibacter sp. TaxID=2870909 RepID=UPI003F35F6D6
MKKHAIFVAVWLSSLTITPAVASGTHAGAHGESAIGQPGKPAEISRTIAVDMRDTMRFSAQQVSVKQGETIRFVLTNSGKLKHEFSLGTEKELVEHNEVMKKYPDMEHDEPGKLTLAPGGKGEMIWRFTKTGIVHFACLHPGHYEAGMKGQIKVSPR